MLVFMARHFFVVDAILLYHFEGGSQPKQQQALRSPSYQASHCYYIAEF